MKCWVHDQPVYFAKDPSFGSWVAFHTWLPDEEGVGLFWRMYDHTPTLARMWPIEIRLSSVALWSRPWSFWSGEIERLFHALVDDPAYLYDDQGRFQVRSRVHRIDFAVDSDEWMFVPEDLHRFVTRVRTTTENDWRQDIVEWDETLESSHFVSRRFSGWKFGSSSKVMRVYDKTRELLMHTDRSKASFFHALWRENGWDGSNSIWRVEVQLRREALNDLKVQGRTLAAENVDEVMTDIRRVLAYLLLEWCSLREPSSDTNRSRWPIDPTWQRIVETVMQQDDTFERVPRREAMYGPTLVRQCIRLLARMSLYFHWMPIEMLQREFVKRLAEVLQISVPNFWSAVEREQLRLAGRLGIQRNYIYPREEGFEWLLDVDELSRKLRVWKDHVYGDVIGTRMP
ncbi:MAG: hypothetical protein K6T76_09405 [Alicyclobacillus mali]|uniref:hypothetical protein n=1 Tax=Alicyclobacillus mali (ex Roth et al. 2021) TaxID=1123961 RepID=UPI0023F23E74|nr:hypothetical protein [Alicyclobacillus mali (ex Roth et al. 2021)]MCL6489137.1 hypothetical protein [Alicyclobacillus mali (ex Roth et al. 2021)]